jgi:hypothetical protein
VNRFGLFAKNIDCIALFDDAEPFESEATDDGRKGLEWTDSKISRDLADFAPNDRRRTVMPVQFASRNDIA